MKTLLAAILVVVVSAACAGAAAPGGSAAPSAPGPTAPAAVSSAEDAVATIVAVNPTLAGIGPEDPELIGGCCFWRANETPDGFEVAFEVGWGDCPAGCIDRHRWTYEVGRDGSVELVAEEGPSVPADIPLGEPAGQG
jgi:hypothetical protein